MQRKEFNPIMSNFIPHRPYLGKYMMKKIRLEVDYDFQLIGLISPVRSYKLVWEINQYLGLRLVRQSDLWVQQDTNILAPYHHFLCKKSHACFVRLFGNHSREDDNGFVYQLVSEYVRVDYILMLEDTTKETKDFFCQQLLKSTYIEMLIHVSLSDLDKKNVFIF